MPGTYAHYKLGEDVKASLPAELLSPILEKPNCFSLGLHGPDPLFYYKPFTKNRVNRKAHDIHYALASEFFVPAKALYAARGKRTEDLAYLFGFVCHFALDSTGHPVVREKMAESNAAHTEIESAFDRFLLLRDGEDPLSYDTTHHFCVTQELSDVSGTYFGITEKQAEKTVKGFKSYSRFLQTGNRPLRRIVGAVSHLNRKWGGLRGFFMADSDNRLFDDSNERLDDACRAAIPKALELIENYALFLEDKAPLSEKFDRNFE